jgi:hypothetical protein
MAAGWSEEPIAAVLPDITDVLIAQAMAGDSTRRVPTASQ